MKLTPHKRKWVADKVAHYSKLLQVNPPTVFLTMAEYNRWKETKRLETGHKRVGRVDALGVCHRKENFIVILPKRQNNLKCLDNTIRHEMIHFAKPSYSHGNTFYMAMDRLKKSKVRNGRLHK